jgi:tetratricopeptide (TPR) repeat protein
MKIWHINATLASIFFVASPVMATKVQVEVLEVPQSTALQNRVEKEAVKTYTAQNPTDAKAFLNRGMSRYNAGDKKGAIADFNQSIKLNPKNADVYNERGITLAELGDIKGAIADFNQAIKVNPSLGQSYHNRGNAYAIVKDKQRAIQDFKKAAEIYKVQGNQKMENDSLQMLKRLQN